MLIYPITVHEIIETNAYFYIDEQSKHGFLIDPGAQADVLLDIIQSNNWTIESILITHGHFDHIGAVEKISNTLHIPYQIHHLGKDYLENPQLNLSQYCNHHIRLTNAQYFSDNTIISLKSAPQADLKVIHTPGHTTDSVIFYSPTEHLAFVGDTIFKNSIGNTSFPGGNEATLISSITKKIFTLPDNTILYSGHTEQTTIANEKNNLY